MLFPKAEQVSHRLGGGTVRRYRAALHSMPRPGDPCPGFIAEPCWQIVYGYQLQATHCPEHLEGLMGLTGLRAFGARLRAQSVVAAKPPGSPATP